MSDDDSIPMQKDENQQAFLRYLPRRIAAFGQRLQRYRSEGWDYSGMLVLKGDLLRLGDASSHHGMLETCRHLLVLARMVGEHVANNSTPDPQQAWRMFAQLTMVTESLSQPDEHRNQREARKTTRETGEQPSIPGEAGRATPVAEESAPVAAAAMEAVVPVAPPGQAGTIEQSNLTESSAHVEPIDDAAPIEPVEPIVEQRAEASVDADSVETTALIEPSEQVECAEPSAGAESLETAALIEAPEPIEPIQLFEPEVVAKAHVAEPTTSHDPVDADISEAPVEAVELSAPVELFGQGDRVAPVEPLPSVEAVDLYELDEPRVASETGVRRVYHLNVGNMFAVELRQHLESAGYAVEPVESVEELSELLMCLVPQMLLVDASHMSELGAIDRIRRDTLQHSQTRRSIQLIALAAQDNLEARRVGHRAAVDVMLFPPFDIADVMGRLRDLDTVSEEQQVRVLIVDDERTDALFAQTVLARAGMEAHVQGNPMQVLETIKALHPDLVLMDLHMPFANGVEVTMLIREDPVFARLPIVFLSGESDPDSRLEAINAGGDDFLFKPIRPRHLIAAVRERMRRMHPISKQGSAASVSDDPAGMQRRA